MSHYHRVEQNPFEGTGIPSLPEMNVQGTVLWEQEDRISMPQDPMSIPSVPRDLVLERIQSQSNRRDRKERASWNYISSGGSINKSSQRNQSHEENSGLAQQ